MKKLFREFLHDLLYEASFKAVRVSADGQRVVVFKSAETFKKKQEKSGEPGVSYRPYNPKTDANLPTSQDAQDKPQPSAPRAQQPADVPKKPSGASSEKKPAQDTTKGVFGRIRDTLGSIAQKVVDLRKRGIAGAGGAPASQGESLFTQFGSALRSNNGLTGVLEQARAKPAFTELTDRFSKNVLDKGDKDVSDNRKLAQRRKVRETIARDFGWADYNDDSDEHRKKVAEYQALREVYVQEKLNEAQSACDNKEEHVFCKSGKAGFGKNEKAYVAWLEAAFDGAIRMDALIRSGGTRIDPNSEWTVLQSDKSKEAVAEGRSPDKVVLDELQKLRDEATADEDRQHYDYQIKLFDDLSFHDTFIVGQDSKGRMVVVHDSNKKSSDLDDPHNNTTPEARLVELKALYEKEDRPEMIPAAQEMTKLIDDELGKVRGIKVATVKASAKLKVTPDMVSLAESSYMKPYMDELNRLATSKPKKGSFAQWLVENKLDWKTMDTKKRLQAIQKFMVISPEDSYSSYAYVFVKMGEFSGEKKIMRDVFGEDSAPKGLSGPQKIKQTEGSAVSKTYETVVDGLRAQDTADGHTPPPSNGRHAQTYVDSVMEALHFGKLIDNYDEDMIMSIGRHAVTPSEIRATLVEILPVEFTRTIDISTPDGRAALKTYLRENCTIDAETGAIVLSTPDGGCAIAEDSWRTAGKTAKVATSFGSCFREKLRKQTSKKPIESLRS